jgi:hypothetical protein
MIQEESNRFTRLMKTTQLLPENLLVGKTNLATTSIGQHSALNAFLKAANIKTRQKNCILQLLIYLPFRVKSNLKTALKVFRLQQLDQSFAPLIRTKKLLP